MKYRMLFLSTLLVLMLALSACGPAASNNNQVSTSTALSENPTSMSTEIPTVGTTSEATTTESTGGTPSGTETAMVPSTTGTAIVPVTGGETLLGVSQSDTMGAYLVDKNGMTVYIYDKDTQNGSTSACTGDCANTWIPVTMAGSLGSGTPGAGTSMPSGSETPGTGGTGSGLGTSTTMPSGYGTETPSAGTGGTGTLGTETPGSGSGSSLGSGTSTPGTGGAGGTGTGSGTATSGTPGAGTGGIGGTGSGTSVAGTAMPGNGLDPSLIGSITRDDGTVQITYNGWPLYTYTQDVAPGDTNGQGKSGAWHIISPSGDPIKQ